jgi:carboxylate-amine ligase
MRERTSQASWLPEAIGWECFGTSPAFSLGVEEELLLVDRHDAALLGDGTRVCQEVRPLVGHLATEIFAAEIELVTPVCAEVPEAATALGSLRAALLTGGFSAIGSGVHPTATLGEVELNGGRRYRAVATELAGVLRTPTAALHVHVGMPDAETAIRVANGMRRHVPLLHALAANSPYWGGRDSGLASARAAILRSYPRTQLPRPFRDWEDFCATAAELAHAARVPDYTYFWWEVRPHPRLGTVEIRAVDVQSSLERTVALAALIQALARLEAELPGSRTCTEALAESCHRATRHGLDVQLLDDDGSHTPARALARRRLAEVTPLARELGCEDALAGVERILREGTGAERQRAAFAAGGFDRLLRQLVAETAGREVRAS